MKRYHGHSALVLGVLVLLVAVYALHSRSASRDGSSVESRQQLLDEAILPESQWTIAKETIPSGNVLISGAYSTDGRSALAVFLPHGDSGYQLSNAASCDSRDMVENTVIIDGKLYNLVWFNGAESAYAELTYTVDGREQPPIQYDTRDMGLICQEAPAQDCALQVVYFDSDGTPLK